MCRIVSANVGAGVTIVPNRFIDEFMTDADGDELKVYLYFMRFIYTPGVDVSFDSVAKKLDLTENKVVKALAYWQEKGLLSFVEGEKGGIERICLEDISSMASPQQENFAVPEEKKTETAEAELRPSERRSEVVFPKYSKKQMENFSSDEHFTDLIADIEEIIAPATTTDADLKTVAGMIDGLDFSDELILHLFEYSCRGDEGYPGAKYVEAIATNWAEKDIRTIEDAKIEEQFYDKLIRGCRQAIGSRAFGTPKLEKFDKWISEYQMDNDLILEAFRRAGEGDVEQPFTYASRIIEKWHKSGVKSMEEVGELDEVHKKAGEEKQKQKSRSLSKTQAGGNSFNNFDYKPMTKEESRRREIELYKKAKAAYKKENGNGDGNAD